MPLSLVTGNRHRFLRTVPGAGVSWRPQVRPGAQGAMEWPVSTAGAHPNHRKEADKWTCKRCFAHPCPRTHETAGAQDSISERRPHGSVEGWTHSFPFVCPSGLSPTQPGRRRLGCDVTDLLPRTVLVCKGRWPPPRGPPHGPHPLWKALRPGVEGTVPLGVGGVSLADGPEWKPHAREEGVPGVRGQGGVGSGVGRHGPVAQRWRVDVRIEPWGEGRVG